MSSQLEMMNVTGRSPAKRHSVTAVGATQSPVRRQFTTRRRWFPASATGVTGAAAIAVLTGGFAAWLMPVNGLGPELTFLVFAVPVALVASIAAPVVQWTLSVRPAANGTAAKKPAAENLVSPAATKAATKSDEAVADPSAGPRANCVPTAARTGTRRSSR